MIPFRGSQGQLACRDLVFGYDALEEVPLVNIAASLVRDLAVTYDRLSGLVSSFGEGGNVGHV